MAPSTEGVFAGHLDNDPNHPSFLVQARQHDTLATIRLDVVRPDLGWHDSPGTQLFGDVPPSGKWRYWPNSTQWRGWWQTKPAPVAGHVM